MFTWMNPWFYMSRAPWSRDVDQNIAPVTSWLSPEVQFNFAGNKAIEAKVISEVASYGKQLGVLTDVVLELARDKRSSNVKELRKMAENIEQLKQKHKTELSANASSILDELQREDPDMLSEILQRYTKS